MDVKFSTIIERFHSKHKDTFLKPTIATFTILCKLNKDNVNLKDIIDNPDIVVRESNKKRKIYKPFMNSITLVYDETKTIKVFNNLSLHVTGCKTINHAQDIVGRFIKSMNWETEVNIIDTKILTLNVVISSAERQIISLSDVANCLTSQYDTSFMKVRYSPDIYHGLILKFLCPFTHHWSSILCFYTGNFIISGIKSPKELWFNLSILYKLHKTFLG
jgi:TATA-box binding protein (TBP) (component of TFIID and TFIIIB)